MVPEKRMYWLEQQPASIPSIHSTLQEDLYVILTALEADGSATLKVYRNPLVNWIWIGGAVFVLGTLARDVAAPASQRAAARRMIRAARWAGALLALVAATGHAQGAGHAQRGAGGHARRARRRGHAARADREHASRPAANAGLPVLLYALPDSGLPGLREGVSDARGPLRLRERLERPRDRLSGRRACG